MSFRPTLLFLCDRCESYPTLLSAFESAQFHVIFARNKEQAQMLLSDIVVDAVLIHPGKVHAGPSTCAALKRRAPQTPILLLTDQGCEPDAYPGIYSVLQADAADEVLARAIAWFLREALLASGASRLSRQPAKYTVWSRNPEPSLPPVY